MSFYQPTSYSFGSEGFVDFYERMRNFSQQLKPAEPFAATTLSEKFKKRFQIISDFSSTQNQLESLFCIKRSIENFNQKSIYKEEESDFEALSVQSIIQSSTQNANCLIKSLVLCLQVPMLRYEALCVIYLVTSESKEAKKALVQYEFNSSPSVVALLLSIIRGNEEPPKCFSHSEAGSIGALSEFEFLKSLDLLLIIASNSSTSRDYLAENTEAICVLLGLLPKNSGKVKKGILHVLYAICQGDHPRANIQTISCIFPAFASILLTEEKDPDLVLTCCLGIASIFDSFSIYIDIEAEVEESDIPISLEFT